MGVGDSLEAQATLVAPIKAGNWHLIGDGIVFMASDVTYDVIWRSQSSGDHLLAEWMNHFDIPTGPNQFDAVLFEADAMGPAADAVPGDQLVLRFSVAGMPDPSMATAFIPNSDGAHANGRIPSIKLPQ